LADQLSVIPYPCSSRASVMDTLPAHLLPLVMEEFPQSLATACVCRAGQREPRLRCVQCGIIEEEEEDCSTLEEDQAQRSFLQTVESLRRIIKRFVMNGSYLMCLRRQVFESCSTIRELTSS
uniref:Uncharacterized protein n=1 Tax=Labrus bergylta TaxID=56723 RepID=A0A3Q3GX13_9LABR